ncbi:MAG TPA: hypothetical protein VN277_07385, partial [Acidiferrobacterales bacterium]|nr:hypothetical protein [Acidiferrobacterales bacterium]
LEVTEQQRERLLIELIPAAYEASYASETSYPSDFPFDDSNDTERLRTAYRIILEFVPTDIRQRIASEFVRVIREGDGDYVLRYGNAFFKPSDLEFIQPQQQAMVREHLLGQMPTLHTSSTLNLIEEFSLYLQPSDIGKWLDPIIRTLVSATVKDKIKQSARVHLLHAAALTSDELNREIDQRLDQWIAHYEAQETPEKVKNMQDLKREIEEQRIPF